IPAKRILEYESSISLNQNISAEGNGILNRLFFLKNQDLASADFILYTQIHHVFKSITGFDFNIVPNQNNNILLKFKIHNEWLIADQCGLGLRELLSMITQISISKKEIILLEEPENHLHADFQKKFISFLKEQHDKQFIISTHSNVFIDHSFIDKVYYCWYDEEVKISDKTTTSKIIDSLGYSIAENLTADAIILTEGPTDIPILKRILTLNETITNYNIKFWPLGGDIMGESDLSIFKGLNKVFAIIDSDPGSSKIRNKFQKNCEDHSITCYKLDRYSIENYIPLNIIKDQFPSQITIKNLDDTLSVDEQIGFKQKNKSIKQKNAEMALRVELKDIQETDLHRICNEIKNILMSKKEAGTNNVSEK
ncbi:MAG: AAA family ATPase, partial [Bacteroidia bacterium]|nr:AAA family ATPase [Bacteroidia bacterium]